MPKPSSPFSSNKIPFDACSGYSSASSRSTFSTTSGSLWRRPSSVHRSPNNSGNSINRSSPNVGSNNGSNSHSQCSYGLRSNIPSSRDSSNTPRSHNNSGQSGQNMTGRYSPAHSIVSNYGSEISNASSTQKYAKIIKVSTNDKDNKNNTTTDALRSKNHFKPLKVIDAELSPYEEEGRDKDHYLRSSANKSNSKMSLTSSQVKRSRKDEMISNLSHNRMDEPRQRPNRKRPKLKLNKMIRETEKAKNKEIAMSNLPKSPQNGPVRLFWG